MNWFIKEAKKIVSLNIGEPTFHVTEYTHAAALVSVLVDRDEPMTEADIRAVFAASGFAFTDQHVAACNPDSQQTVNDQIDYYKE